jgi:hypothetical protein
MLLTPRPRDFTDPTAVTRFDEAGCCSGRPDRSPGSTSQSNAPWQTAVSTARAVWASLPRWRHREHSPAFALAEVTARRPRRSRRRRPPPTAAAEKQTAPGRRCGACIPLQPAPPPPPPPAATPRAAASAAAGAEAGAWRRHSPGLRTSRVVMGRGRQSGRSSCGDGLAAAISRAGGGDGGGGVGRGGAAAGRPHHLVITNTPHDHVHHPGRYVPVSRALMLFGYKPAYRERY